MNRFSAILLIAAICLAPSFGGAQEQPEAEIGQMRAPMQKHPELGVVVHRPDGWIFGKPGDGVAALLRAAGDSESQIEIRVSKHVKKDHSNVFFTSFHANIQRAGFEVVEERKKTSYGGRKGSETEYETGSDDKAYRLVVWQYHREDRAYLVVGFFPNQARPVQYADFKDVCEKLEIE